MHPFLKTLIVDEYPEQIRKAIRDFLNHPENFLKHADLAPTRRQRRAPKPERYAASSASEMEI